MYVCMYTAMNESLLDGAAVSERRSARAGSVSPPGGNCGWCIAEMPCMSWRQHVHSTRT